MADEKKGRDDRDPKEKGAPDREEGQAHTTVPPEDERAVTGAATAPDAVTAAGSEEHSNALATPEVDDPTKAKRTGQPGKTAP